MSKRKGKAPAYPRELMPDVCWSFADRTYSSRTEFEEAVRQYHHEILEGENPWRPEEVVLHSPRVRVEHEYWDEPEEAVAEFTADDGTAFTAGELLYKVHNAFAEQLSEGDHHFFEGFSLVREQDADVPLYEIDLGS